MDKYDLVVLLGSQIKLIDDNYVLAPHTEMKAKAGVIALEKGITEKMIISGGYNFCVRYDLDKVLTKPDFSFTAFSVARFEYSSEAQEIANFMTKDNKEIWHKIYLEELSATTEENAEFVKIMLKRTPTFDQVEKVGILTLLYHMEKALPIFRRAGIPALPLFAEELLVSADASWVDKICGYYITPKGGKQYNAEKIRELLTTKDRFLEEILQ